MPKQFTDLAPFFKRCSDGIFTGYDPSRTLRPANALSPVTRIDPVASAVTAATGFHMDPGPSSTAPVDPDRSSRKSAVQGHPIEAGPAETGHILQILTNPLQVPTSALLDQSSARYLKPAHSTAHSEKLKESLKTFDPKSQGGPKV